MQKKFSGIQNRYPWKEDERLFVRMQKEFCSENERIFFETLAFKQKYEEVINEDVLLLASENTDGIYLYRLYFEEYEVGVSSTIAGQVLSHEEHVMNLSQALNLNLQRDLQIPLLDMTFFEWLRRRDYEGIQYHRNADDL